MKSDYFCKKKKKKLGILWNRCERLIVAKEHTVLKSVRQQRLPQPHFSGGPSCLVLDAFVLCALAGNPLLLFFAVWQPHGQMIEDHGR